MITDPDLPDANRAAASASASTSPSDPLKIGIVVVAYNAQATLAGVLDRVPRDFWPRISQVFVCDDASQDSTYLVGLGYTQQTPDLPLKIIRHPKNLGYGGNQKAGYRMAIEQGLDVIVLLHGDGQYAPEVLPEIIAPLERGEADAVMGSRMMVPGAARRGGMPLYKYVGNRILTRFENHMLETSLTEFHSGYRAYRVDALKSIQFDRNSDGFNFDTQIIIQLIDAGRRIVEVPIPTYYGDEICRVDGLKYAKDVSTDVVRYRLARLGFDAGGLVDVGDEYSVNDADGSHSTIINWVGHGSPGKVLDLGCSGGLFSERIRRLGHEVVGVDVLEIDGVRDRIDHFIQADLDQGLPPEVVRHGPYDVVLCADILEHVRDPERILSGIRSLLTPDGVLIASVPNFGHWYARARVLLGLFDYDQRGVLDEGHVRFFMRRGLMRRFRNAGYVVVRQETTGLPLDMLAGETGTLRRILRVLDRVLVGLRPQLFGYQFVTMCKPEPGARAAGAQTRL